MEKTCNECQFFDGETPTAEGITIRLTPSQISHIKYALMDTATAAAARQAYVEASDAAWKIYRDTEAAARKEYNLACVPHFVAAINAEAGERV